MNKLEKDIEGKRIALEQWLREVYGESYGDFFGERDIGYDHWDGIEGILKTAFEDENLERFSEACLDNILFFISRGEEGGRIIAWFRPDNRSLSNIADLKIKNFVVLCKHALKSGEDYCDYQLAYCFHKLESLSKDMEKILLDFFKKKAIYTKRLALVSLTKHRVANLENYIIELWDTKDEWAGLNCLEALKVSGCNDELFKQYKKVLLNSNDEYIRENAEKF
ncbi:MAG: hypothetical protein OQJ80_01655 [Kangiella sp.]|nr:hypothetical protein [Kangiella sp.]